MSLQQKQILSAIVIGVGLVLAILWWEIWLGKLGLGLIMAGLILDVALVRCPVCGAWLGKYPGDYCHACGTQLDWNKRK